MPAIFLCLSPIFGIHKTQLYVPPYSNHCSIRYRSASL